MLVVFEIAPEHCADGWAFSKHEERENENKNDGRNDSGEGAEGINDIRAEVFGNRSCETADATDELILEIMDADLFAGVVNPREVLRDVVDSIWEVFCEAYSFVYDSRNNDHDEGDNTADDDSVGNGDWKFIAFAWN